MKPAPELRPVRRILGLFIIALFLSGATAIPIDFELDFLLTLCPEQSSLHQWLRTVLDAYRGVAESAPFLLYGYDWLAFAHLVLAILFIGPYRDPVRNIWVIKFGLIACGLVLPLALIAGPLRGIPWGWQLIDCSFGVFGAVPLWICYTRVRAYEKRESLTHATRPSQRIIQHFNQNQ